RRGGAGFRRTSVTHLLPKKDLCGRKYNNEPAPRLLPARFGAPGRGPALRAGRYAGSCVQEVIVIPPLAFWTSVTRTRSAGSSSAAATSSRIRTASASAKQPSFRKPA